MSVNRVNVMDLYLFTLGLSFGALLLMAVLGLSHHHAPGKIASAHGHGPGHHHGRAGKLSRHFGHTHSSEGDGSRPGPGAMFLAMVSPRTLFSLLLGFGATGPDPASTASCRVRAVVRAGGFRWLDV